MSSVSWALLVVVSFIASICVAVMLVTTNACASKNSQNTPVVQAATAVHKPLRPLQLVPSDSNSSDELEKWGTGNIPYADAVKSTEGRQANPLARHDRLVGNTQDRTIDVNHVDEQLAAQQLDDFLNPDRADYVIDKQQMLLKEQKQKSLGAVGRIRFGMSNVIQTRRPGGITGGPINQKISSNLLEANRATDTLTVPRDSTVGFGRNPQEVDSFTTTTRNDDGSVRLVANFKVEGQQAQAETSNARQFSIDVTDKRVLEREFEVNISTQNIMSIVTEAGSDLGVGQVAQLMREASYDKVLRPQLVKVYGEIQVLTWEKEARVYQADRDQIKNATSAMARRNRLPISAQ